MSTFGSITAALKRSSKQSASTAASAEHPARRFNTEDISIQLQRVLAPLQIENLSLHNAMGELVWRNDGAFGDDEQAVVLDALDMFALDEAREDLRLKLDDDRSALFACARDTSKVMRGVALVIVETPESEQELTAKLSGPRLQVQMRRFAQLLAPPPDAGVAPLQVAATQVPVSQSPLQADAAETLLVPRRAMAAEEFTVGPDLTLALAHAQAPASALDLTPAAPPDDDADGTSDTVPVAALSPPPAAVPPPTVTPTAIIAPPVQTERRVRPSGIAPDSNSGSIPARRYTRLRAGGAARRYEVRPSSNATFKGDLALTTLVAAHVQRSLERYTQTPSTFTVPLNIESVTQGGWLSKVNAMLTRCRLPPGMLGFSLPSAAWRAQPDAAERFIAECEAVGCFIALDDFSLQHSGLALLRSGAVKCLKLDARLIAAVVNDRFAHAQVVAIVQAARVLGLYCVAKQVTSTSQAKWLSSAGIEFADGVGRGVIIAGAPKRESTEM